MNPSTPQNRPVFYLSLSSKLIAQSIFMGAMLYFLSSISEAATIQNFGSSTAKIQDSEFFANDTLEAGGAMKIVNSTISDNSHTIDEPRGVYYPRDDNDEDGISECE